MTNRQGSSLQDAISSLPKGPSRRYSRELKARIVEVARAQRAQGASWEKLSKQLGVSLESVRRWCAMASTKRPVRMQRVRVVAERSTARGVSVISAGGHRIEGLTVQEAVTVLRALG
jgi:transposase-like protein